MVPQKTCVSENFGPISKAIVIGFKVAFLGDFASRSESQICSVSVLNFETGQSKMQTADCRLQGPGVKCRLSVKCRLQTESKTQTGVKCRPSINCSRGRV